MRYTGEYGGRVLRAFKADVPFIAGALIEPEKAMSWPLANRKALESQHKVEWFGPPVDEAPQKAAPSGTKKVEEPEDLEEETLVETDEEEAGAEEVEESEKVAAPKPKKAPAKKSSGAKKSNRRTK